MRLLKVGNLKLSWYGFSIGAYEGRPQELTNHIRGVLTNPNCEFDVNFIAMHTLAQWSEGVSRHYPELAADAPGVGAYCRISWSALHISVKS